MKILILIFLFFVPLAKASVCLRAPGVTNKEFADFVARTPGCEHSSEDLLRSLQQASSENELDSLLVAMKEHHQTAAEQSHLFESYFDKKKEQFWSDRDLEILTEVLKRWDQVEESAGKRDQIRSLLDQLDSPLPLARGDSLNLPESWADAKIFRNAKPVSSEAFSTSSPAHWAILSSQNKILFLWGPGREVLQQLKKENPTWLGGNCENPVLNFETSAEISYFFLYPKGCVARHVSLVRPPEESVLLPTPPPPAKSILKSPWFWAGSAIAVGLAKILLQNKTLVIRPAFK